MTVDYALLVKNLALIVFWLLVLPGAFIALLTGVNRNTKQYLANGFGINSELYLGFIGIFFHELSHLIVALLFGHHITQFRLLKRPHPHQRTANGEKDLALGYVNHTWNQSSWYQSTGNLFIGIAPIFGCSLVLLGLTAWLLPDLFNGLVTVVSQPLNLHWEGLREVVVGAHDPWWHWLLMGLLAMNISVGGFDLSSADFANSQMGLIGFIILIMVVTAGWTLIDGATGWLRGVAVVMTLLTVVLTCSLLISLVTNFFVRIVLHVKWHH